MRTAVVEIESGLVVNVIERGVQPPNPRIQEATEPPEGFLWVEHETAGPGWTLVAGALIPPAIETAKPDVTVLRAAAYRAESDLVFFRYQRDEATKQEWLDKVAEIKARFPK